MKRTSTFFLFLFLLVTSHSFAQSRTKQVSADHDHIAYTGRIDFTNKKAVRFAYPGVSVKLKFSGTGIDVVLESFVSGGETNTCYIQVVLDGVPTEFVALKSGKSKYTVVKNVKDSLHVVEIFKASEASVGTIAFHGFFLEEKSNTYKVEVPKRSIEFIGNSLTCGYGNMVRIEAPPKGDPNTGFHSVNENNYYAWGAITARKFDASYYCTAYSGRGMLRNNTGSTNGVMPQLYAQIIPDQAQPEWNTNAVHPDIIVIELGTNDFFTGIPDSAEFVNAYANFVNGLLKLHPNAKIICCTGTALSDWWPEGEKRKTRMNQFVQGVINKVNQNDRVYKLSMSTQTPPYGEDWHPSKVSQQIMADQLISYIINKFSW